MAPYALPHVADICLPYQLLAKHKFSDPQVKMRLCEVAATERVAFFRRTAT
jgi:hypothetical protein